MEILTRQYAGRDDLTEFAVPEGVTVIGEYAFAGCKNLEKVTIPDSVEYIAAYAFAGCESLGEIAIPDSVKGLDTNCTFAGCDWLTTVRLPVDVPLHNSQPLTREEPDAVWRCFKGSLNIRRVILGTRSFRISGAFDFAHYSVLHAVLAAEGDAKAFAYVKCHAKAIIKMLAETNFPELRRKIFAMLPADLCTMEVRNRMSLPLENRVLHPGTYLGRELPEKLVIPDTFTEITARSFRFCDTLKEVYVPDSVQVLDPVYTFRDCTALETVRLPVHVKLDHGDGKTDRDNAGMCFTGCTALKTLILGDRRFEISGELNDAKLLVCYAHLAAEGNPAAIERVKARIDDVFWELTMTDALADTVYGLFEVLPEEILTEELLTNAADSAGVAGHNRTFDTILDYMKEHGMDTSFAEDDDDEDMED